MRADDAVVSSGPLHVELLQRVLRDRPEVLEAYVFGSQARGDVHAESDLDIAVYVDLDVHVEAPFGYPAELATVVGAALGTDRLDIVVLNEAPPLLYGRVLRDGVRIVARDLRATTVREGYAMSRYCDWLPQLRKIEAAHRARIARGEFGT
jgi:predicted nucleotidyltransferase